jgi:hypothetical protein
MRTPLINTVAALRERITTPQQVDPGSPESDMPPYMESFLAHLRLLIGVPFAYLVPDSRMLPPESIRFFYLDRSWADRLVDGAVAVGKIGTREQAHHQAHEPAVRAQLDQTERIVRKLQQGGSFIDLRPTNPSNMPPADVVTGFLLRSYLVTGWPQMDVRAYSQVIQEHYDRSAANVLSLRLQTLRLERLSPAIMIALFQGIPKMVTLEEPHHGIQFGVEADPEQTQFSMFVRKADGEQIPVGGSGLSVNVPMRSGSQRVIDVAALWKLLGQQTNPLRAPLSGGGSFALQALNPPWCQHFEGTVDQGGKKGSGRFVPFRAIANRVSETATQKEFEGLVQTNATSG